MAAVERGRALMLALAVVAVVGLAISGFVFFRPEPFIERPADPVRDPDRFEKVNAEIGAFLKASLGKGFRERDLALVGSALADDFRARSPMPEEARIRDEDGLRVFELECDKTPTVKKDAFLDRVKALLERYAAIERCTFRPFEFLLDPSGQRVSSLYHWQMMGRRENRRPIELQCDLRLELVRSGTTWKIRRFAMEKAVRLESDLPPFVDVTNATGFEFAYRPEGRKTLQSAIDNRTMTNVGALAVVDWNRDGFPDVIATNEGRRSTVFVNDGKGGFVPEDLPEEGGLFYLSLDLDGDGQEELISTLPAWYREGKAALGLYTRAGAAWKALPEALVFDSPRHARELLFHHVAACDINRDGLLDLYVCGYSSSESGRQDFNFIDANTGLRNLLFINQGGLRFREESEARGISGTRFSYVSEFFDYDKDGDQDLLVATDFAPDVYYRNRGDGTFEMDAKHPFAQGTTFSMGLAIADYDNTGDWGVYVSCMYSHAGNRIVPLGTHLSEEARRNLLVSVQGNLFYEMRGGKWVETGIERNVNLADWAWGCVFFDPDNDGDKDLFVVNGFTSHSDPAAPDY